MKSIEILGVVALSLFSLLGIFLLSKRNSDHKSFGWLGIFFLLLAINFLDGILLLNASYLNFPRLIFWEDPFAFLYGPLILGFSLQTTSGGQLKPGFLLHLIPFLLLELAVVFFHFNYSSDQIQDIILLILSQKPHATLFVGTLVISLHVLLYIKMALKVLDHHKDKLKQRYASISIAWAYSLIRLTLMIFLLSLFNTTIQYFGTKAIYTFALLLLIVGSIALTLRVLLQALKQPMLRSDDPSAPATSFYMAPEEVSILKDRIASALRRNKRYTHSELTLKDLAAEVECDERSVSYVINRSMADNFYDLINNYRIEEAKRIFETNPDPRLTILEVLYSVGYNSKSSFNTQFHKKTGLTPSKYRQLHRPKDD